MNTFPLKFRGKAYPYMNSQKEDEWGAHYIRNEKRSNRLHPLHPDSCPFCEQGQNPHDLRSPMSSLKFGDETYLIKENGNPIVENQLLIYPAPSQSFSGPAHRVDLNALDVRLIQHLAMHGFSDPECIPTGDLPGLIEMGNQDRPVFSLCPGPSTSILCPERVALWITCISTVSPRTIFHYPKPIQPLGRYAKIDRMPPPSLDLMVCLSTPSFSKGPLRESLTPWSASTLQ